MEVFLLHEHELKVYIFDENSGNFLIHKEKIEQLDDKNIKKIRINDKSLYAFECEDCPNFYQEYRQNIDHYFPKIKGYVYFSINKNYDKKLFGEVIEFFNIL